MGKPFPLPGAVVYLDARDIDLLKQDVRGWPWNRKELDPDGLW